MAEIGMYIYGIINCNTTMRLFTSNGVYTIPYQDISAVVADSEMIDYTHLRKDALARLLVDHQKVIEKIMGSRIEVVPMRLGTFAQNETEVRDILSKGYNLIKEIFEKIKDKIEIDVACTWSDFNSTIKEVGEEKEIKEFKEKLLSNPKGITVEDRVKVGVMVKKALEERREKYAQGILEALKTVSFDFKTHELMDDKMIGNIAFLINKLEHKDFEIKVEGLNIEFNEKLNFRCVGPLPPYTFCTLEIKKLKFEEIDWAKKRLGILDDITNKAELKKAYRRQAFSTHPDKNPNEPCAEKEFDEVNRAYNVLWEYCQKDSCSFKEDEFKKNAILIKVRG